MIFVTIATIVGLVIASRYFKYKKTVFLYMGLAWTLIACPWWPSSISVFVALATKNDEGLSLGLYLLIGNVMVPVFLTFLIAALTELMWKDKQKILIMITIIIGILFEIYLIYYFIVDPSVMGTKNGVVDIEFSGFVRIYLIVNIIVILIAGILIARVSIKSEKAEIRLKGRFLLISVIIFFIGAAFDGFLPLTLITLTIMRLVLISSSIFFYFGFIPPKWLKNLFIKE